MTLSSRLPSLRCLGAVALLLAAPAPPREGPGGPPPAGTGAATDGPAAPPWTVASLRGPRP